jgi:hypothetical protein
LYTQKRGREFLTRCALVDKAQWEKLWMLAVHIIFVPGKVGFRF